MSSSEAISATNQRIKEVAYNIAEHYVTSWRDRTGRLAIRHPRGPRGDRRGGPKVQTFWKQLMDRYGSEENYLRETLSAFRRANGIEILIVVDKLLTGFDEPRNAVLYAGQRDRATQLNMNECP